jgi:hypothetical protein
VLNYGDPEIMLWSVRRFFRLLPASQQQQFFEEAQPAA